MTTKAFTKPAEFHVYVTVSPTKRNGLSEGFTARIGNTNDEAAIKGLITKDLAAMGETFGGLMAPTSTKGREYRAFRAEWTEVTI